MMSHVWLVGWPFENDVRLALTLPAALHLAERMLRKRQEVYIGSDTAVIDASKPTKQPLRILQLADLKGTSVLANHIELNFRKKSLRTPVPLFIDKHDVYSRESDIIDQGTDRD